MTRPSHNVTRMRSAVVTALLLASGIGCAPSPLETAESAGAPTADPQDAAQNRSSSDLIDVRGDVQFDRSERALRAELTYTLVPGATELGFLLNGGLAHEVTGEAVTGSTQSVSDMSPDWNRVAVHIDPAHVDSATEIRFSVKGAPVVPDSRINQISEDWIELGLDAMWHPIIETIDRWYVAELRLHLPPDWQVVSSGEAMVDEDTFLLRNMIPQVDIAFLAAPGLQRVEQGHYALYHRGAEGAVTERLLRRANDCRNELDRRFGERDPLPRGRFVMAERSESGYARKNYVVLTEVSETPDAELTDFLCHELAHYWSSRGAAFTVDNWLNEGFATLVGVQAVQRLVGDDAYDEMVDGLRRRAQGLGSIWTPDDLSRRSYAIQYKKAPLALLRLEERIGDDAFERFVRAYMAGVSSTPELLASLEEFTDEETRAWFQAVLSEDDRASG